MRVSHALRGEINACSKCRATIYTFICAFLQKRARERGQSPAQKRGRELPLGLGRKWATMRNHSAPCRWVRRARLVITIHMMCTRRTRLKKPSISFTRRGALTRTWRGEARHDSVAVWDETRRARLRQGATRSPRLRDVYCCLRQGCATVCEKWEAHASSRWLYFHASEGSVRNMPNSKTCQEVDNVNQLGAVGCDATA